MRDDEEKALRLKQLTRRFDAKLALIEEAWAVRANLLEWLEDDRIETFAPDAAEEMRRRLIEIQRVTDDAAREGVGLTLDEIANRPVGRPDIKGVGK